MILQIRKDIAKPKNLKDLIRISEKLSKGFSFLDSIFMYLMMGDKIWRNDFYSYFRYINYHSPEKDLILVIYYNFLNLVQFL